MDVIFVHFSEKVTCAEFENEDNFKWHALENHSMSFLLFGAKCKDEKYDSEVHSEIHLDNENFEDPSSNNSNTGDFF